MQLKNNCLKNSLHLKTLSIKNKNISNLKICIIKRLFSNRKFENRVNNTNNLKNFICYQFSTQQNPSNNLNENQTQSQSESQSQSQKISIVSSAAVALIEFSNNFEQDSEFLIVKRAIHEKDNWSGQLALPGGKYSAQLDNSLLNTAIRETKEECGLTLTPQQLFQQQQIKEAGKSLNKTITVAPFIFRIYQDKPKVFINIDELVAYCWLPKSQFLNVNQHKFGVVIDKYPNFIQRYFLIDPNQFVWVNDNKTSDSIKNAEQKLWGFTYRVISEYTNFQIK
eukprot:TRINITY_DN2946_c5_g1_i1.p1 TRINITY_DN2946_c5_g1~~TRINITY_DN2946_c5_g1_i1.p1  ORF type:complete len:281 (-),score=70.01 TRINITY_DN2946_c5_g1_i1:177-1019(-)